MKRHQTTVPVQSHSITLLPDDCLRHIFTYINPTWKNWKRKSKYLHTTGNTVQPLTIINKSFNVFFSPEHIANLLHVDATNKNLFLLRSAQAGIPCLVHYAINTLKANINYDKKNELPSLGGAVNHKNHQCVRLLLTAGAKSTPYLIHLATGKGDLKMVKLLLEFKADPNAKTPFGYTPIKLAILYEYAAVAKLLVESNATVEQKDQDKLIELLKTLII